MADLLSGALSAVGSLGGLFGKKAKSYSPREMVVGHVEGAMQAAEAFGLHPLAVLGNVGGPSAVSASGGNYLGSAIADSAMMLADGLAQRKDAQKLEKANNVNEALQRKVTDLTLRPKVGGVYQQFGGSSDTGSGQSLHLPDGPRPAGDARGAPGLRPLEKVSPYDPRRPVDHVEVSSDPGFITLDNPYLGQPFPVPAIGGEPLDIWQLPVVGAGWGFDRVNRLGKFATSWVPDGRYSGDRISVEDHPHNPNDPRGKPPRKPPSASERAYKAKKQRELDRAMRWMQPDPRVWE